MDDRRSALKVDSVVWRGWPVAIVFAILALTPLSARAADIADARGMTRAGKYAAAIEESAKGVETEPWREGWWLVKVRAELITGQYEAALNTVEAGVKRHAESVPLRLMNVEALRYNNRPDDAEAALTAIKEQAEKSPWRFDDATSRVAVGRAMLMSGADARQVLENYYDKAKKDAPESAEPYLASGELALDKHDYGLALEAFTNAAKRTPDDPDVYFGLARAYENDSDKATEALAKALKINPDHVGGLLFQAENLIDREAYAEAAELLDKVLAVNPHEARGWAYRAVLAHLSGDAKGERDARAQGLAAWASNPEVDHVIGESLSSKYRFAEGAAYQRQALTFAPTYRPARVQLCQDLLRLGQEEEGWALAAKVFEEDPYNVVAFNLIELRDHLAKFHELKNDHFLLRMDDREAQVYGDRAMALLERARTKLCAKYGAELGGPVTVEIFPRQQDFAIRTFGLPGGAGFLGVCFGPVVTVNSPASRMAHPADWEAILWHEFCHTVTLHLTRNKMPRWLSEGISVYEERQENPAWGQVMNPQYRDLILDGGATPVSQLSGAFLKPPSAMHLQFAYYESSMVVRYIVEKFGAPALSAILKDLGESIPINTALANHTEPIDKLDEHFEVWFTDLAKNLAPGAELAHPKLPLDADAAAMAAWNEDHPTNFWGLLGEGRALLSAGKWGAAKKPLTKAIELYPGYAQAGGPYLLLAAAHRELKETKQERAMLERHVALDADAIEPRLRLIEIARAAGDWAAVRKYAEEIIAVNPLLPAPHRALATAAEESKDRKVAITARRTLLLLDTLDVVEQRYRLAKLLADDGQLAAARSEVVRSLEEAPRYRAALALLLDVSRKTNAGNPTAATTPSATRPATPAAAANPASAQPTVHEAQP
jgi:tetratricopeptide (TPR) repeat protein